MLYRLLADLTVLVHLAFVLFVALGGLLVWRWHQLAWVHIPCALWGIILEFAGWICPLTPLENHLRALGGEAGYSGGFIAHYILPVLYPDHLTPAFRIVLAIFALTVNLAAYTVLLHRLAQLRKQS
jgi:uncharacterized protein DUF2784